MSPTPLSTLPADDGRFWSGAVHRVPGSQQDVHLSLLGKRGCCCLNSLREGTAPQTGASPRVLPLFQTAKLLLAHEHRKLFLSADAEQLLHPHP